MINVKQFLCLYVLAFLILIIPMIIILIGNMIVIFFLGVLLGMYISCLIVMWCKDDNKEKDKKVFNKIFNLINEIALTDDSKMSTDLIKMTTKKIIEIKINIRDD